MKICSWDVGIYNLAYCIMEYKPQDGKIKYPIHGWDIINIVPDDNVKCHVCLKRAKYVDSNSKGYCLSHKKTAYMPSEVYDIVESKTCHSDGCSKYAAYNNGFDKYYCKKHGKDCIKICCDICGGKVKYKCDDKLFCTKHKNEDIMKKRKCVYFKNDKKTKKKCVSCDKKSVYYDIDNTQYCVLCKRQKDDKFKKIMAKVCAECNKNATRVNKNGIYYCTKHGAKYDKIKKIKCISCDKNATYVWLGKYCCTIHKNKEIKIDNNVLQLAKKNNAQKINIDILLENLVRKLDKVKELQQVEHVIIENQPTLINPRMKTIASALYTYFLIRGKIDKNIINKVQFISPSNKLKVDNDNTIKVLKNADNEKYKLTKKLGIKYCKQLVKYDTHNLQLLDKYTKIDDLCDAMLQGAYYLSCT